MSTFSPQKPAPGWQRRWPAEAFQLMLRTPWVVAVVLAVSLGVGLIDAHITHHRSNIIFHAAAILLVGTPLLTWMHYALGKHERYISGPFDHIPTIMRRASSAVMALIIIVAFFMFMIPADAQVQNALDRSVLMRAWISANFILTTPMFFVYQGMFVLLVIPLVNAGDEQNVIIAQKAHAKLVEVWPRVTLHALLILFLVRPLVPPYLFTPLVIFAYYVIYVAGREIIGGITGNAEESKAPVLAPT